MRVQISLDEDYAALKKLADEQDRTVAGQARHMLRRALKNSHGEARAHEINAALQSLEPDASPDPFALRPCCGTYESGPHATVCGAAPKDPLPG